jgi:hypothetical protein
VAPPSRGGLGVYLGVVQFFFAATWIVYVIYLPQLVVQAGLSKASAAWILMADQFVFVLADYAAGVAADRMGRVVGRIGLAVLAATVVSALAFLALPFVAPQGSPAAFVALILIWAVSSSALRAPPLALLGKHVARPSRPLLIGLSMLGLGVANACAPYVGLQLRGVDPRIPFVLSSIALALVTCGLVGVERALARRRDLPEEDRAGDVALDAQPAAVAKKPPKTVFFAMALLAALAFQVHVFIDSAPLYRAHAPATLLPVLTPVFWIGFNVAMLPLSLAVGRWPAARAMGAAAFVAAAAAALATVAPTLWWLVAAQLAAGAAWAGLIVAAFAWALARSGAGSAGAFAGALSAVLALATLARMASVAVGWPQSPAFGEALAWWPVAGWLAASIGVVVLIARRPAQPA